MGRNHGILRYRGINVTPSHDQQFAAWMGPVEPPKRIAPLLSLPHIQPRVEKPRVERERLIYPVARGTKKFLKKITGITSESEVNENIVKGLRYQFSEDRVNAIIDESFTEFYSRQPNANRPELYELYESGFLDNVLDRHSIRWVVGRPKKRR